MFERLLRGNTTVEVQDDPYPAQVAPEAVEIRDDSLVFPGGVLFPLSVRSTGVPGSANRPWGKLGADVFFDSGLPTLYSLALRREAPDMLKRSLRSRRTLFDGVLRAASERLGRRPSLAEQSTSHSLDAAESQISMGKPVYTATLLAGLFVEKEQAGLGETARRTLEGLLRARGLIPQRLTYIAEQALHHFQPGGALYPGFDEPTLLLDESLPLMPAPTRRIAPSDDALWLGRHARDGRDVYFSYQHGFDPGQPPPPHAISLILGEMGSRKTTLMRWMLLQRLLQGHTVISIDPEGENNSLCEAVGGHMVPAGVPDDPNTCLIHPLQAETPAEMLLAARFLVGAIGGAAALTPGATAALHEAVKRRWERRPGQPVMISDLVETLGAIPSPEARAPMSWLLPYARGGLWEGFFDRPQALLSPTFSSGGWWNFDLSTLRPENRAVVHAVLTWFFYHAVTVGKRPLDIYADEGWRLLRSGPFADLLDELGRRARKRGVGVVLVTHLPGDLSRKSTSLSMATTAFIGRMGPEEAYNFFRAMGITESESRANAETVSQLPPGVFLAASAGERSALFPVATMIPPAWLEFWRMLGAAK